MPPNEGYRRTRCTNRIPFKCVSHTKNTAKKYAERVCGHAGAGAGAGAPPKYAPNYSGPFPENTAVSTPAVLHLHLFQRGRWGGGGVGDLGPPAGPAETPAGRSVFIHAEMPNAAIKGEPC
jgi:hypothetical protein